VLMALRVRGPVNNDVISTVYDIVYSEPDDEDGESEHAQRLAEDILDEWEEKYPDTIARFVLLK